MTSLASLLAAAEPLDGGFRATVPPEWHQGRTAYGGFSSALCLAAAMRVGGDLAPLRSAQLNMIAPVAGEVEVRAQFVRSGKNAAWIAAEISGEKGVCFSASFVFMGPVESALHINERPLPEGLIAPAEARVFEGRHRPAFLRHQFEIRFALPRREEKQPELCWWVRLHERQELDPMIEVLLVGDALPPGVMPLLTPSIKASTMQWQASLLTPAPSTDDGWWLLRTRGDYAEKGCSSQRMAMWNAKGEPVLAGAQSVALFG